MSQSTHAADVSQVQAEETRSKKDVLSSFMNASIHAQHSSCHLGWSSVDESLLTSHINTLTIAYIQGESEMRSITLNKEVTSPGPQSNSSGPEV